MNLSEERLEKIRSQVKPIMAKVRAYDQGRPVKWCETHEVPFPTMPQCGVSGSGILTESERERLTGCRIVERRLCPPL